MHAANALLDYRGIPGQAHIDNDRRGMLQIEADAAGGVRMEAVDQAAALLAGYAAMKQRVAPAPFLESPDDQLVGGHPLTEDDRLRLGPLENFIQQRDEFIDFGAMIGLAIKQVGTITGHSHVHQATGQSSLVGIRSLGWFFPIPSHRRSRSGRRGLRTTPPRPDRVKIRLDQFFEFRAVSALRVRRIDDPFPFRSIAGLRDESQRIFVASQVVAAPLRAREKTIQVSEILSRQSAGGRPIEKLSRTLGERPGTVAAGPEAHLALAAVE